MANTGQFNVCCSGDLNVDIHRPGLVGMFRGAISADCLQFSIKGIQIETAAKLFVGEKLILDLEVHDMRVEELQGTVRSISAVDDKHYYDIDFSIGYRKKGAANTIHCLRHLENHLRHQLVAV